MKRVAALDGLRGLLACVVLADHAAVAGLHLWVFDVPAHAAVLVFFAMSAMVLGRAWDNRFGAFLQRRFARLFPVYFLAWLLGMVVAGRIDTPAMVDGPIWSLNIEAVMMLGFPAIVWAGVSQARFLAAVSAVCLFGALYKPTLYVVPFLVGSRLRDVQPVVAVLETAVPQWLGKISYSLYLTHWIVLNGAWRFGGEAGVLCSVPLCFAIGWLVWRFVERPSIALSRRVGAEQAPHFLVPGLVRL